MELELEVDSRGTHGVQWCSLVDFAVAIGRAVAVAEVWQRGLLPGPVARRLRLARLHSLIMSDFLGHIEFLISPPQDHSGDRALECWTSCVWCMHVVRRAPS